MKVIIRFVLPLVGRIILGKIQKKAQEQFNQHRNSTENIRRSHPDLKVEQKETKKPRDEEYIDYEEIK